jgi:ectoine hydroxylase-related dioxygenase (phytanoyl-CoA dioxygenase family)
MLTTEQVEYYAEYGYLRIAQVFTPEEMNEMSASLDRLVREWALTSPGWTGPWRRTYMDEVTEKKSKLTAMHDLHFYSAPLMRAFTHPRLAEAMSDLLGPNVELHHSTLHIKPPESGHPFPMHQDYPFYPHENDRYVDVLVHFDDTSHANGEIRFLGGSHKLGPLEHITQTPEGPCSPHLPTDVYRLEDTVPVPAARGDVVCFNINTIHGSHINTTDRPRRLIRVGFRDPQNWQTSGQSFGRPGLIVHGYRDRRDGQQLFKLE